MFKLLVATNNEKKVAEYRILFKGYNITLYSLNDLNIKSDPDETGNSYKENAAIKVKNVMQFSKLPVISDDSGIEVDALGGRMPGIFSHRYVERFGTQEKANGYLASFYSGSRATFNCAIALGNVEDNIVYFSSQIVGSIVEPRGNDNFGYDPIFLPQNSLKTYAEMSSNEKNTLSHRAKACFELINYLKDKKLI